MKHLLSLILTLLISNSLWAQETNESLFRQSGKIYVVVAILVIIFTGIVWYLIRLDKKISKLEEESK